nr:hypothetical protein [Xylanibacter ruminicola]
MARRACQHIAIDDGEVTGGLRQVDVAAVFDGGRHGYVGRAYGNAVVAAVVSRQCVRAVIHIRCRIGKARLERDNRSRNVLTAAICCVRCAYNLHIGRQIDGIGGSGGCRHGHVASGHGECVIAVASIGQRQVAGAVVHFERRSINRRAERQGDGFARNRELGGNSDVRL